MTTVVVESNNITIDIDQGRAGRGITDVNIVTVGVDYYLVFTFTDGTTEQVGPVATAVTELLYAEVRNAEASAIQKGQPVYLYQAQGNLATVKLAYNTSDATSAKTLGLAAETIASGAQGLVLTQGTLNNIDTSAYAEGATLYLGATPGTLTATKPQAPNHLVYIGVVERANAGAGQIYVRVQNGYELDEIHDVQIIGPANGQTIVYDSATSLWKNAGIGSLSGTLGTINGGTGLTSFTANGVVYASSTSALTTGSALTFDGTNLGVGTTNPAAFGLLAVNGASASVNINATTGAAAFKLFEGAGTGRGSITSLNGSDGLAFLQGVTEAMRLTSAGLSLAATSNLTLNAGTANGVLYLNGSKVATSGTAMIFDGTNLGIGISPAGKLDVYATGTTVGYVRTANQTLKLTADDSGNRVDLANVAGNPMSFTIGVTEGMRLTSTGLGIGTSSPASLTKLTVYQDSTFAVQLMNASQNYTLRVDAGVSNALILGNRTSFTDLLTVSTSGILGLGVTPSAWNSAYRALDIGSGAIMAQPSGSDTYYTQNAYFSSGGQWLYKFSSTAAARYQLVNGVHSWHSAPSGTAGSPISFSQVMTLDASGQLGIGTSSPAYKLDVVGQGRITESGTGSGDGGFISNTGSANGNAGMLFQTGGTSRWNLTTQGTSGANLRIYNYTLGSTVATFDSSGNLGLGVTPSAWSGYKTLQAGSGASFGGYAGDVLSFVASNAYNDNTNWKYILGGNAAARYQQSAGTHAWSTAPSGTAGNAISFTQAMTLDASGNLGIGTSSPGYKLSIAGTGGAATINLLETGVRSWAIRAGGTATNTFDIADLTASQTRLTIDSSGNLGLGVTPSAWISAYRAIDVGSTGSVYGRTDSSIEVALAANGYRNSAGNWIYRQTAIAAVAGYDTSGAWYWKTAPSGTAGNPISFTQAMTLVGTTTPALLVGTTVDLAGFNFQGKNTVGFSVHNAADNATAAYFSAAGNVTLTSTGNFAVLNGVDGILFGSGSTERARITSAGDLITNVNAAAPTLSTNSTMSFELTSNTSLKIVVRGTDGTTRSVSLTLA